MALASSLRKVASKLTGKFGGDVTISRIALSSYNTTTGAVTETATNSTIKGVLENVNAREVNELVQASDKKLTIAAADLSEIPTTVDKVVINNITHQIIQVATIEQDNTAIVHELILRA